LLVLAVLNLGCPYAPADPPQGDSDGPEDSEADSDTDSDADSDTDSDTDADPEVDPRVAELDPFVQPSVYVTPVLLQPGGQATVHYQGELAQASELVLRYGFNGWNMDADARVATPVPMPAYSELSMDAADVGFSADIELPSEARALHMTFYEEQKKDEVWDDNDGLEYHQGVVFPYIGPFLTWNDSCKPDEGVVINWESSVPCLGVVAYGSGDEPDIFVAGESLDTMHHVALCDLAPDSEYVYRVYDSAGRVSDLHRFRTAAAQAQEYSFIVLADAQDSGSYAWEQVAAHLVSAHADASFAVFVGDLTYYDEPGDWWTFFDLGRAYFAERAIMPVPGNHDTPSGSVSDADSSSFERYFSLPLADGSGAWYSFDYGNSHFLGLNSEIREDFAPKGAQYDFAESDLQLTWDGQERIFDHVFAYWHIAPYNAGSRHDNEQWDFREITALFDGNVDWVFSGHEHLAQRMVPLRYDGLAAATGDYGVGPEDGVGYMVLPPAGYYSSTSVVDEKASTGAEQRQLVAWPELPAGKNSAESEMGFVEVQVLGDQLLLRTWGMGDVSKLEEAHIREELAGL